MKKVIFSVGKTQALGSDQIYCLTVDLRANRLMGELVHGVCTEENSNDNIYVLLQIFQ